MDKDFNIEGHVYILDDKITYKQAFLIVELVEQAFKEINTHKTELYDGWKLAVVSQGGYGVKLMFGEPQPRIKDVQLDVPLIMGEIGKQEYILLMRYEL